MKISCVLTAVNENPKYTRFIPLFIEVWKKRYPEITPIIIYVGTETLDDFFYKNYGKYIKNFESIPNISSAYVSQTIRILYPALLSPEDVVMITDIDCLPGNSNYFSDIVEDMDNEKFVITRTLEKDQIIMTYNIAKAKYWKEIFSITNENDIRDFLIKNYNNEYDALHGGNGWFSDQKLLYNYVISKWQKKDHILCLNDKNFQRLDWEEHCYLLELFLMVFKTRTTTDLHIYAHLCPWSFEDILKITHYCKLIK